MPSRFLNFFRPIVKFIPEASPPDKRVSFGEKLLWTGLVLVIYLIMSEIPLYGISRRPEDPFYYMRVIFASTRGTLTELGIGPIVTAGLILQLLAGSGIITVNFADPNDRTLFTGVNKVFSIVMTVFTASVYILGGAYGEISLEASIILFSQLISAGLILMLLDELVQKGWGIGSGISLFIIAGVARGIFWNCFAPIPMGDGKFLGAILAFVQSILNGEGLWGSLHRQGNLPDMIGFISTVLVFLIVIYFESVRIELPISYARYRGFRSRYPVKLLYVSNIPVILSSALFANIYLFSQILWSNFNQNNENFWLSLLGTYDPTSREPTGGLVLYVIPPRGIETITADPGGLIRAIVYVVLMVTICVMFAKVWIEVGGLGSGTAAKQLIDAGMQIPGFRRSYKPVQSLLNKYVPTLTLLGGLIVGAIAAFADLLNVFGTGMGALLAVGILYQLYQQIAQEQIMDTYPMLRRIIG